ncbi:hypothetical protein OMP38_26230 [Cohnella ginsengisoli]|uniref:Uncharacterized protein n=1 Tax=Cohnella ginsengisoli TaxID=425004 RepID=A0A9X4KL69_9BACL|nr:hypothetical protein [Cohnella ginsengisoli]MDG0793930.1 hypothetical protein [Cohnella ginsengisoli]
MNQMFSNLRIRLAILNAAVLLLVLLLLSSVLYVHLRHRLIHEADEVLMQSVPRIESFHNLTELIRGKDQDPQQDEKTTYLFWDPNGSLIGQSPRSVARSEDSRAAAQAFRRSGDSNLDGGRQSLSGFDVSQY